MTLSLRRQLRLGLRLQLSFGLGLLCVLLVAIGTVALVSLLSIQQTAQQAIQVDGQLSQLAHRVATATLSCRRFEKDQFLNIDDPDTRAEYQASWDAAYAELGQAIEAFAVVAPDADARQVVQWRLDWQNYGIAMADVSGRIERGQVTTPQAANAAMTPYKQSVRRLTDSALEIAATKAAVARAAEESLDQQVARSQQVILAILTLSSVVAGAWVVFFPPWLTRPITRLRAAVERVAAGDLGSRAAAARADEIGELTTSFNQMADVIQQRTAELEAQHTLAASARAAAEAAHEHIAEQLATIEGQRSAIRQMSVPVLPVSAEALVMPLIGEMDRDRLALMQERILREIERLSARYLILDITGVPVIDADVAEGLAQTVQAARLLGAEVVVVGIRPEIAQTIVGMQLSFAGLVTRHSLQGGIAYAQSAASQPRRL